MKPILASPETCTGCSACASACLTGAISMKEDEIGFVRPFVDSNKCIGCKLCSKVCPILNKDIDRFSIERFYGCKSKHIDPQSSSGGIASAIYQIGLKRGFTCYGTVYSKKTGRFQYQVITNENLPVCRGSKYVQADIGSVFKDIKNKLNDGNKILFVGTPCVVAGLKYLTRNNCAGKLYLVDFVCHGVPSQRMLFSHLINCGVVLDRITNVGFRDGEKYKLSVFSDKKTVFCQKSRDSLFFEGFHSNRILRKSCFRCLFSNPSRVSDLTIGDFWGFSKTGLHLDNNRNISFVSINNSDGQFLYELLKPDLLTTSEIRNKSFLLFNECLIHPSKSNKMKRKFDKLFSSTGSFDFAIKHSRNFKERIKNIVFVRNILNLIKK